MPEPTDFLSHKLPPCSVIRPIKTNGVAMGAAKGLTDSGLFMGQPPDFFRALHKLAAEADAAQLRVLILQGEIAMAAADGL